MRRAANAPDSRVTPKLRSDRASNGADRSGSGLVLNMGWDSGKVGVSPEKMSSGYDSMDGGLFPMEKDTIVARTPPPPKVSARTEPPVRTMSMGKAKKLIRKTSGEHAELFRRLAK